jgi:hypothetical protein
VARHVANRCNNYQNPYVLQGFLHLFPTNKTLFAVFSVPLRPRIDAYGFARRPYVDAEQPSADL